MRRLVSGSKHAFVTTARILVVDDDASARSLVRTIIEEAGFTVAAEARDGAEAIRLANDLHPDLITMDLDMPVMNGAAATAQLCKDGCAPILIVSGSQSSEMIAAALAAGARWHVTKRDVTSALVPVICALLEEAS